MGITTVDGDSSELADSPRDEICSCRSNSLSTRAMEIVLYRSSWKVIARPLGLSEVGLSGKRSPPTAWDRVNSSMPKTVSSPPEHLGFYTNSGPELLKRGWRLLESYSCDRLHPGVAYPRLKELPPRPVFAHVARSA
ncbi:hypothetical protein R1flu_002239 [Riccia fluitans]|uniref:Uncharacterized protein n=1 Tax=Riccia fluitans TaxID=41844 RepID=A0ABD1Y5J7_9MARC